jgi:hypothetical protein
LATSSFRLSKTNPTDASGYRLPPAKHWPLPYFPRRNALDSVRVQVLTLTEALIGNSVSRAQPAAAKLWSQQADDKFANCNFAPVVTGRIEARIAVNGRVSSIGSLSYCWANWFLTAGPPVLLCFRPLARLFPASDYRIVPFLPDNVAAESMRMRSASRRDGHSAFGLGLSSVTKSIMREAAWSR